MDELEEIIQEEEKYTSDLDLPEDESEEVVEEIPLMTVYFNKRTGTITDLCTGQNDMNWYGEEKDDYALIFDFVVIEYDAYVFTNHHQFKVIDGAIKLCNQSDFSKYL